MVSWGNLADRLEQWAASKYALLASSPSVHGGGGQAGLGVNGETGRFENLDAFYVLRRYDVSEGWTKTYDVRDYWTQDGFKQEAGFSPTSCYSRSGLEFPFIQTRATLPDFSGLYDAGMFFCGFELGGGTDWGYASFKEIEPDIVRSRPTVRGWERRQTS